jgi:hypothetical protein
VARRATAEEKERLARGEPTTTHAPPPPDPRALTADRAADTATRQNAETQLEHASRDNYVRPVPSPLCAC